jgi:hypothetical protein
MTHGCTGLFAIAAPLSFIALAILVIGVLEYLRRKRTENTEDDW